MSLLRKFRNILLGLNHVVFSEKIENWIAHCHFWENLGIVYLLWTMLCFQRKLRTEQPNVIFDKISKYTTSFEPCFFLRENWELNNLMSLLRKFRNRLLGLNHLFFSEKTENWIASYHVRENLEIDSLVWTMLSFQRKLKT